MISILFEEKLDFSLNQKLSFKATIWLGHETCTNQKMIEAEFQNEMPKRLYISYQWLFIYWGYKIYI